MKIELLTEAWEDEYTQLILQDEQSNFYSSLLFRNMLERITSAEPRYLVAVSGDKLVGVLPAFLKRNNRYGDVLNSLPWYGSNPGITVNPFHPEPRKVKFELLNAFKDLAKKEDVVTSTLIDAPFDDDLDLYDDFGSSSMVDIRIGMRTILDRLGGIDELLASFRSSVRNQIRKAAKEGVVVYRDMGMVGLSYLIDLHTRNMKAMGVPPKDANFFNALIDGPLAGRDYLVYVAKKDGESIAALLLMYFNKTISYWIPVIEEDFRVYSPMNLLIYMAMIDGFLRGYKYWDWGGTALLANGVYNFKKKWGSEERKYCYYTTVYKDIGELQSLGAEVLMSEYPYFYVFPFLKEEDE